VVRIRKKRLGVTYDVTWFASGAFDPAAHAPVTYFRQHSLALPPEVVVQSEPFHTLVFDLSQEREVLYKKIAKNCRYEIERAGRERISVCRYQQWDDEVALFLERHALFHGAKHYGEPLGRNELEGHDWTVYKAERDGTWLSYLLLTRDEERTRMWVFINNLDYEPRAMVGYASRKLVWHSICDAQEMGLKTYDFGGVVLDETDSRYGVTVFKRYFGGDPVTEYNSLVITPPLLRAGYRAMRGLRK
jgi:hypothetical protein